MMHSILPNVHDGKRKRPNFSKRDEMESTVNKLKQHQLSISLKAQVKPVDFPPDFNETIEEEYATRYLERIGAVPNADNIALVLKNAPINKSRVTAAWKSRGCMSDVLYIDPHPESPSIVHPKDLQESQIDLMKQDDKEKISEMISSLKTQKKKTQHEYKFGNVNQTFEDIQMKYLYPFNQFCAHKTKDSQEIVKHQNPSLRIPTKAGGIVKNPTVEVQFDVGGGVGKIPSHAPSNILKELLNPIHISYDTIRNMQQVFFKSLPFESMKDTVSERERSDFATLLESQTTQQLVGFVVHYLYWTILRDLARRHTNQQTERSDVTVSDDELKHIYMTVLSTFELLKTETKRQRHGSSIWLPLIVLSVRVAVETSFINSYPRWFEPLSHRLKTTLRTFNVIIDKMMDPEQHFSRISVFESSLVALREISSQRKVGKKHVARLRDQFFLTSPTVHNIFPNPSSGLSRKIMKEGGGVHSSKTNSSPSLPRKRALKVLPPKERSFLLHRLQHLGV